MFDALLAGDRIRELKTAARAYDEGGLSRHVQISTYATVYPMLFGPDAVIEVVALLKQRHPRITVHEVTRTAEQRAWFTVSEQPRLREQWRDGAGCVMVEGVDGIVISDRRRSGSLG